MLRQTRRRGLDMGKKATKTINTKMEIRTVCSLFDGPDEVSQHLVAELRPSFFGYKPAKAIFKRAKVLFGKRNRLPSSNTAAEDPALAEQCQLILRRFKKKDAIKNTDDADAALETLKHWRKVRKLFGVAKKVRDAMVEGTMDEDGVADLLSNIDTDLVSIKSDRNVKLYTVGDADCTYADEVVEKILYSSNDNLLPTGFDNLDRICKGFARGNLIILAASSGGGKSTVAMNMAVNQYLNHNKSPAIISLEMGAIEYHERLLSCISGVSYEAIREHGSPAGKNLSPVQLKKIDKAWRKFRKHGRKHGCKFSVFPVTDLSATELRARLVTGGYDYWIVDYLNLLDPTDFSGSGASEAKALGDIARFLKNTAELLGVAVIALTQISDDFRVKYSRAVKEHANFVLKWKYDEDAETSHVIKVVFDKGRSSRKEDFYLLEDFPYMTVKSHSGPPPDTYAREEPRVEGEEPRRRRSRGNRNEGEGMRKRRDGPKPARRMRQL